MRYLLILLVLTSCYSKRVCIQKFCTQDSVTITIHDTLLVHDTIPIASDSGYFKVNIDSLTDSLKQVYSDSILSIQAKLQGREVDIRYITKEKRVPYEKKVPYVKTIKEPCKCPQVCPDTEWQKAKAAKVYILIALILGMCLGMYMKFRR